MQTKLMQKVHDYANQKEPLRKLSQQLGISAGYILIASILLGIALMYSGFGGLLLILVSGFLYPGYMTFKALKKDDHEALTRYSKYWIILSIGVVAHELLLWLMPNYQLFTIFSLGGILLLLKSDAAIATTIYDSLIMPTINKYESHVDSTLNVAKEKVDEVQKEASEVKSRIEKRIHESIPKDKSLY